MIVFSVFASRHLYNNLIFKQNSYLLLPLVSMSCMRVDALCLDLYKT
ncbi:hypothetical protein A1OE_1431 [Candidatus Endolissoclinum faulkneri L2]|uniref:Uncharacterized protein n=1 Tax=Candidatus Endolissoclinum faulkneri L2 TaxID=1193729 RepID=K7YIZ4_9PROT|nr:hypothetical protein A1OE_1431 [Candidatus Endolissoclinum faulkneri L2]